MRESSTRLASCGQKYAAEMDIARFMILTHSADISSVNSWKKVLISITDSSFLPGISCVIMLLAFVMDIVVYFKSHRIDIDPESHTANEVETKKYGEDNLLKLRKMSQDVDEDHHMKIPIGDEN